VSADDQAMTTVRRSGARTADTHGLGGTTGNARLTALTAIVLLVLLAVEGATLLSLQTFLSWHIFVGMLLVPAVGLKIGSTGYKFVRYYTGKREYVAEGPPPTFLRMLGPIVVISTLGLFATGVGLAILGPGGGIVLGLHKASFVVWLGAMGLHVLAHLKRVSALASDELRGRPLGGSGWRAALVASAIVGGATLAIATLPLISPWVDWMHGRGGG
jgi:hypothetical protein